MKRNVVNPLCRCRQYPAVFPKLQRRCRGREFGYLVDPASSHMLVSKIKPCMSKYILFDGETANGSLNQLWFLRSYDPTWITVAILELIHAKRHRLTEVRFYQFKTNRSQGRHFGESG